MNEFNVTEEQLAKLSDGSRAMLEASVFLMAAAAVMSKYNLTTSQMFESQARALRKIVFGNKQKNNQKDDIALTTEQKKEISDIKSELLAMSEKK